MFSLNPAVRARRESRKIIEELSKDKPYTELRYNYLNTFNKLAYEDMMGLVRSSDEVQLTSHEIADIFERTGYDFAGMAVDIARLIRDKQALIEKKNGNRNTTTTT